MGVGTSVKRLDAIQKVTGSAKYVEDLIPLDALHMKVVHSSIANGLVTAIDTTEAERMPGVELIITCFDVPDVEFVTAGHPLSLDPAHADTRDKLILSKRVLYYGDDVAAVIADTPLNAQLAAEKLVDTILAHAARTYKLPKDELRLASEQIWHRDSAVCTLAQLCTYINFVNDQKTDTDHITAEATFTMKNICLAYGVSFMDLEVDVPVGKVKIRKVYCLQDSGKIINPQLAEGQMHGGVAMGIGYALGEQMLFDAATGRPLNNNLLDYKIPTCMDIPDMEIRFVETHEDSAPFGAKGLAEPPLIPQAAAVRNAILHATGVGMHKLPMNPQNLVHAFGEAGLIAQ